MKISSTPWGPAQVVEELIHGIIWVSTATHGGFLVPKNYANTHFSEKHLQAANQYCDLQRIPKGYYAFEEDCAAYAILCEVPEIRQSSHGNLSLEEAEKYFDSVYNRG